MKLRLMPILEHMGACDDAKSWIRFHKFDTFAEAWARCPDALWIDWLIDELWQHLSGDISRELTTIFAEGCRVWKAAAVAGDCDEVGPTGGPMYPARKAAIAAYYAPFREKVEQALIQYAREFECAEECE